MDTGDSGIRRPKEAASVARVTPGFTEEAGPLNAVKIDLAVILCLAVLLWLVLGKITSDVLTQLAVLGVAGVAGMAWIIIRARKVLRAYGEARRTGPDADRR